MPQVSPELTCDPETGTLKDNAARGYSPGQMGVHYTCMSCAV